MISAGMAMGMSSAEIWLENEKGIVSRRDRLLGHAILAGIDAFDGETSGAGLCGFRVEKHGMTDVPVFKHPFAARAQGIVTLALESNYP